MGQVDSSFALSDAELASFQEGSAFTIGEIRILWGHFMSMSDCTGMMDKQKFIETALYQDAVLQDRMFLIFDSNKQGTITFKDYVMGLSKLSNKTSIEIKLKVSFLIYDKDQDGYISVNDLNEVLTATMREHGLQITFDEINQIVEATFKEADVAIPGKMSFDEYEKIVATNPDVLSHLSLNISNIISEYSTVAESS